MTETAGKVTIGQAIEAGWAARPTLYRAISQGRLTVEKSTDGRKLLDVSELVRVYGEPRQKAGKLTVSGTSDSLANLASEVASLRLQLQAVETEKARLSADLAAAAADKAKAEEREVWLRGQVEATQRLLTDQRPTGGLWKRLLGRSSP